MKTRKSILLLVVLLVLVLIHEQAGADFVMGNSLVKEMREYDKSDVNDPTTRHSDVAYFMGYVTGVNDALSGIFWENPPRVTVGQICSIVSKYLKNHPERWNESARALIFDALKEAFPLKK